jgi:lysophospholipase L1-like esterase
MLRRSLFALCAIVIAVPLYADDKPNPAATPAEKDKKRHEGFLEDVKKKDGKIDVVFLGDSITDGWRGAGKIWDAEFGKFNPLNLGIGGDRTQHVLWRIQHDELSGYKPKAFVIMIGTNNMGSNTPEEIAGGNKAILDEIKKQHPDAKVLLLAIFPRSPKATDAVRDKIKKTNELLEKMAGGNVKYKDIGAGFLTDDGTLTKEIMPDYLHLSQKGYQIWADSIKKELEEMTK